MTTAQRDFVPYWRTDLGEAEIEMVASSMRGGCLSQGKVTKRFEAEIAKLFGVPHAVCTVNGSAALFMAVSALGIGPGDEIILPNRTFVATAHAVMLAGAGVRLVDTHKDDTIVDETLIEARITPKTKAIFAVHLNGNNANMRVINDIARRHGLKVIEDAAQAFYSRNADGFLGAQSDLGCFSLGVTKFITTGQGGVVITKDRALYERLLLFRNHGVSSTFVAEYKTFGFNLKFNDILASVGLVQLQKLEDKKKAHFACYNYFRQALAGMEDFIQILPVDEKAGNVPLWVEVLVAERDDTVARLAAENIQVRPFLPDLDRSPHLGPQGCDFPNSRKFSAHGIFLPSGPDIPRSALERTAWALKAIRPKIKQRLPVERS